MCHRQCDSIIFLFRNIAENMLFWAFICPDKMLFWAANTSNKRRRLLYMSFQAPEHIKNELSGSTYSLLPEYQGGFFKLKDCANWEHTTH
jgi:hypothetical protein